MYPSRSGLEIPVFRLPALVLAAAGSLLGPGILRAESAAVFKVKNNSNIPLVVSLLDEGQGAVEFKGLGTLSVPRKQRFTLAQGVEYEMILKASLTTPGINRVLRVAEGDGISGWCFYRLASLLEPGKPTVIKRAGVYSAAVVYPKECKDSLVFEAVKEDPAAAQGSEQRRRGGVDFRAMTVTEPALGQQVFLLNNSAADLLVTLQNSNMGEDAAGCGLLPKPEGTQGSMNYVLKTGTLGACRLRVALAWLKEPEYKCSLLIHSGRLGTGLPTPDQAERFSLSFGPEQPMQLVPDPFLDQATKTPDTSRNFKKVKFTIDASDPEAPVLMAEKK